MSQETVKIYIDDREIEAPKGKTVLQVALENGIEVPYFCYHPSLPIAGACRMCVVYWEDINRLVIACNLPVQDGMKIRTHRTSELVREQQKYLLQALMTRHPLDCPVCDKAGECDLQNLGALYGPQKQIVPVSPLEKERHQHDWESEFLEYYSNRCVVCYRCTRTCDEVVQARALYVDERGFHSNIAPAERPLDTSSCEMCGACVAVCPVGAILSKPFKFQTRSWLLEKAYATCTLCPVGCNLRLDYGTGGWRAKERLYRVLPDESLRVCARAFFGYDAVNEKRLRRPVLNGSPAESEQAVNYLKEALKKPSAFVLSAYLPLELIRLAKELALKTGAYLSAPQTEDFFLAADRLPEAELPSPEDFKEAELVVVVGDDLTGTAPVLSYGLKKPVYRVGRVTRDAKLKPGTLELDELKNLTGKALVVLTPHYYERPDEVAEKLNRLCREKGWKLRLLPKEPNALGLYRELRQEASGFLNLLDLIKEGRVKTLVLFGEEALEFTPKDRLEQLLKNLEHLVVVSPFTDGLASKAHLAVPTNLLGEQEGTFLTCGGPAELKPVLPWAFDELSFWRSVLEEAEERKEKPERLPYRGGVARRAYLYAYGWIAERSVNLKKLARKNHEAR
ncbi:MAG: 2Fe-2S iron-sulfur cluster binding domain-containing protein [Aquificae bacterium]|nr:2Fe-2S iron-sulfur cluster binding domain-containing protein [Aquificota bacterium]